MQRSNRSVRPIVIAGDWNFPLGNFSAHGTEELPDRIGMMIPNSPANVGTFWYFLLLPLQVYGISGNGVQAMVFALFVWLSQMGQMTLFGVYFLGRTPIKLRDVALADLDQDSNGNLGDEQALVS